MSPYVDRVAEVDIGMGSNQQLQGLDMPLCGRGNHCRESLMNEE